ncbi:DUF4169 family protein [Yoonia sp. R2331]|uniref:DUF4169 family protein n=1 Tax=Yoonia sp. R2331 TaxID=3237238 RepID=UPI0034E5821C
MTTPINLNKVRKARDRAADKTRADENAVKFGRTKAERVLDAAKADQAARRLDQLKFEDE